MDSPSSPTKPFVLCIIGKSNCGKTTLIEKLIPVLQEKGIRVSTIKHTHHDFQIDHEGKDSYRHKKAGSISTAIIGPKTIALVKDIEKEWTLNELVSLFFKEEDLVLVEGFKESQFPMIIIVRENEKSNLFNNDNLIAIVSDKIFPNEKKVFQRDNIDEIGQFIIEQINPR